MTKIDRLNFCISFYLKRLFIRKVFIFASKRDIN